MVGKKDLGSSCASFNFTWNYEEWKDVDGRPYPREYMKDGD